MNYSCSQCSFTAQFESALVMHRQLHHDGDATDIPIPTISVNSKANTLPRETTSMLIDKRPSSSVSKADSFLSRTSSATRILGRLRARICKSKILTMHPEEPIADLTANSECSSKALKRDSLSYCSPLTTSVRDQPKESYLCHLCDFEADRITVLDRHLLNDHKIGLESLLQLVMAKTKEGLTEDVQSPEMFGIKTPYYKLHDEIIEQGDFIIESVSPKIKILKHAAVNTDLKWTDIPDLKDNCRKITKELDKLLNVPVEKLEHSKKTSTSLSTSSGQRCTRDDPSTNTGLQSTSHIQPSTSYAQPSTSSTHPQDPESLPDFFDKMNTLNECMCKFVDSSNTLKMALSKEYQGKHKSARECPGSRGSGLNCGSDEPRFSLRLDDPDSSREWEKAHSEQLERYKRSRSPSYMRQRASTFD